MEYEAQITWNGEKIDVIVDLEWYKERTLDGEVFYHWYVTSVTEALGEYTFTSDDFRKVADQLSDEDVFNVIAEWEA